MTQRLFQKMTPAALSWTCAVIVDAVWLRLFFGKPMMATNGDDLALLYFAAYVAPLPLAVSAAALVQQIVPASRKIICGFECVSAIGFVAIASVIFFGGWARSRLAEEQRAQEQLQFRQVEKARAHVVAELQNKDAASLIAIIDREPVAAQLLAQRLVVSGQRCQGDKDDAEIVRALTTHLGWRVASQPISLACPALRAEWTGIMKQAGQ